MCFKSTAPPYFSCLFLFSLLLYYLSTGTKGELFSVLEAAGRIEMQTARHFFAGLISGVSFLHQHGIIHRDISLENILLHADGDVRICDFGLSSIWDNHSQHGRVGKKLYMAPEVYGSSASSISASAKPNSTPPFSPLASPLSSSSSYDGYAADIWSCGIVLFIMVTGVTILEEPSVHDPRFTFVANGCLHDLVRVWGLSSLVDDSLCDLIQVSQCVCTPSPSAACTRLRPGTPPY